MDKSRSTRANRQKPGRVHSIADRIRSGIPVSRSREPKDPPTIPHTLNVPLRIRLNFVVRQGSSVSQTLQFPVDPASPFNCVLTYRANQPTAPISFSLLSSDIMRAAAIRLYGVDIYLTPGQTFNQINTDYAIVKTTLYGPDHRELVASDVQLSVDFGPTIPGFSGRDSGGANTRAIVSATAPRLSWFNLSTPEVNTSPAIHGYVTITNLPVQTMVPVDFVGGCLDITVQIRRGFLAI